MWKLHRDDTSVVEQDLHAGDEIVNVGHLSEHVVADDEIGALSVCGELPSGFASEEFHEGRHTFGFCHLRDVGSALDAEDRDLAGDEILEQITIIAGELDDVAGGAELPSRDHL